MKLNHIALSIEHPEDIDHFYSNILGMSKDRSFKLNSELAGRIFKIKRDTDVFLMRNQDVVLEIFLFPENKIKSFHHICISLKNRDEVVRKAIKNKYQVICIERDRLDLIFIKDKSGNIFEIKEES